MYCQLSYNQIGIEFRIPMKIVNELKIGNIETLKIWVNYLFDYTRNLIYIKNLKFQENVKEKNLKEFGMFADTIWNNYLSLQNIRIVNIFGEMSTGMNFNC